jgi:hypothetical protein
VNILGYKYKVEYASYTDIKGAGEADFDSGKIRLLESLNSEQARSAILHEIIEVINETLNINMMHDQIEKLEVGLFQVFVDSGVNLNPLLPKDAKEEQVGRA